MSFQADAMVLAGTIYAKPRMSIEQHETALYATVDTLLEFDDERKADLYARMAERLASDTPFEQAVSIITKCLIENESYYRNV